MSGTQRCQDPSESHRPYERKSREIGISGRETRRKYSFEEFRFQSVNT